MPNPYVMWSASGSYGTNGTFTIGTVPAMALSSKARIIFGCAHLGAGLRPNAIEYVRASDGAVLGYANVASNSGMPGTPFGGSIIGAIGGTGSPLDSDGGTLRVVISGAIAGGSVSACIIDGGESLNNILRVHTDLGANGGTVIADACVYGGPGAILTGDLEIWWVGISVMNCDHSQTPVLSADPDWESAVSGPGNAIAVRLAPPDPDFATLFSSCPTWTIGLASTFCRAGMVMNTPIPSPFGFAQIVG